MAVDTEFVPYWEERKDYSQAQRDEMAKNGQAMSDGSFPIADASDLANAIRLVGNSNSPKADVIAHIKKRAKALGLTDKLPQEWRSAPKLRHRVANSAAQQMRSMEFRAFSAGDLEIRNSEDPADDYVIVTGCPIKYGAEYEVFDPAYGGTFKETMMPGSASGLVSRNEDACLFLNHNTNGLPYARTSSGTMDLEEREDGLWFTAKLSKRSQQAMDLVDAIERGDIRQMSAGFRVAPGGDQWNGDQRSINTLGMMPDISAVTHPASPTTMIEIAQRMAQDPPESFAYFERLLAEAVTELRAGKVISGPNHSKLVNAFQNIHEVLTAAGTDTATLIGDQGDTDEADGTAAEQGNVTESQDNTGLRSAVEDHPASQAPEDVESTIRQLELEKELLELRRRKRS